RRGGPRAGPRPPGGGGALRGFPGPRGGAAGLPGGGWGGGPRGGCGVGGGAGPGPPPLLPGGPRRGGRPRRPPPAPHRGGGPQRIAVTVLGAVYLGLPLATLMLTRRLPDGAAALANIVVGTWVFDTASYVGGRLWGRNPIAPLTSPGKTIEGFVCGLVVGTF